MILALLYFGASIVLLFYLFIRLFVIITMQI
nr:MAG TPA: hypothetical protein [Caudoviricetes sp.]